MDDDIEDIYLDNDEAPPPRHHHGDLHNAVETREEYKKVAKAILGVLVISSLLTTIRGWELRRFIADFMALFFIANAAFKFVHIEDFVTAYRRYDIIGSRLRPWGYVIAYIEALMGFWYLLSDGPERLNILALIITGIGAVGSIHASRKRGSHQSLGGIFRVSLLKLSIIENVVLFALTLTMFVV